jgi:hypothetical protein
MRIIETKVLDTDIKNLDLEKIKLSERIIKKVSPILDKTYYKKLLEVRELDKQVKLKKEIVLKEKKEILNLIASYEKKKKIADLLNRISNLLDVRIPEGSAKKELVVLLKIAEKLDSKKIDSYIKSVTK